MTPTTIRKNLRTILRHRIALAVVIGYTAVIAACGVNIFSESYDADLGAQLDKEIRSNPKEYPILQGHAEVKTYVKGVVNTVLASPEVKKRAIFAYAVEIIHDDKTVNAFCTPGGYIYVYTGLMKFLDNEASLAGVLGHEIAHAECRHATKRMTTAYGAQMLIGIVLGKNPDMTAQIAANLFTNLGLLKNSRDDEMEADNQSMLYLKSTSYYPGAIKYFFDKIGTNGQGGSGSFQKLFLTHPPSDERAHNVDARMKEWNIPAPAESAVRSKEYQAIRKRLP
jgi:beta-barrel assembly-enhancing protease